MDLGVEGLRVLVTAGAGGIGLEIARSFVREGARVHVCDVDDAALASLAASDPGVTRSRADLADRTDVTRLFEEALHALGGLDVLVNNAGIAGPTARVDEADPEDWGPNAPGQHQWALQLRPSGRTALHRTEVWSSSCKGSLRPR